MPALKTIPFFNRVPCQRFQTSESSYNVFFFLLRCHFLLYSYYNLQSLPKIVLCFKFSLFNLKKKEKKNNNTPVYNLITNSIFFTCRCITFYSNRYSQGITKWQQRNPYGLVMSVFLSVRPYVIATFFRNYKIYTVETCW